MDRRRQQIAANLKPIIADVFQRQLADPRIKGMLTITSVAISKDLRNALVKISVYPAKHESVTIHGVQSATLRIQKIVNKALVMRRPPHLKFELDQTVKKEAAILAAINEAIGDLEDPPLIAPADSTEDTESRLTEEDEHPE